MSGALAQIARVPLEPPYTRDGADPQRYAGLVALEYGPILARTRGMTRWHRVRSGVTYTAAHYLQQARGEGDRTVVRWWCSTGGCADISDPPSPRAALLADVPPPGEPLCGTCEGRAIGAGHPPVAVAVQHPLLFSPYSTYHVPDVCPAGRCRLVPTDSGRHFPCPACGEPAKYHASGGPFATRVTVAAHRPGAALVAPCPFHAWEQLVIGADGRARCRCSPPAAARRPSETP